MAPKLDVRADEGTEGEGFRVGLGGERGGITERYEREE